MRALLIAALLLGCGSPQTKPSTPPKAAADHHGHHGHHGHEGGPLVHRFEKADEWTKVFDDPARDAWQKPAHVVSLMKIEAGSTVADLGTGTGYFLRHLSSAVGEKGKVLALDVEPDMIRYVKERAVREKLPNVEARVIALDDPGLGEATADRVLIVDTWHHIPERRAYAKKLARGLRPKGMVFVVDFTKDSERGPPKHHRLAPETVIEELASAGLTARVEPSELPDQFVVVGQRN